MHDDRDVEYRNGEPTAGGRNVSPTLIGLVVVVIATVIFIFQNTDKTKVRFLFIDPELRVWVAIAIAVVLGAVLDRLFSTWWRRRRERED